MHGMKKSPEECNEIFRAFSIINYFYRVMTESIFGFETSDRSNSYTPLAPETTAM